MSVENRQTNQPKKKSDTIAEVSILWNYKKCIKSPGDSVQHTIELNSKGMFACPKFTRFFNDDDIRIS